MAPALFVNSENRNHIAPLKHIPWVVSNNIKL